MDLHKICSRMNGRTDRRKKSTSKDPYRINAWGWDLKTIDKIFLKSDSQSQITNHLKKGTTSRYSGVLKSSSSTSMPSYFKFNKSKVINTILSNKNVQSVKSTGQNFRFFKKKVAYIASSDPGFLNSMLYFQFHRFFREMN